MQFVEAWKYLPVRADKAPACKEGVYGAQYPTIAEEKWPKCTMWGIATGKASGITVLDIDSKEGLEAAKKRGLPPTLVVKTPRGYHFYYKYIPDSKNKVGIFPGADVRSDGGYVVGIKEGYKVVRDLEIADAPAWLRAACRDAPPPLMSRPPSSKPPPAQRAQKKSEAPTKHDVDWYRATPIQEGRRNLTLFAIACQCIREGVDALRMLMRVNIERCVRPVPEREIERIVWSASRYA